MKLQLHRKYKKLFLTPHSTFDEKAKVDLVLSPQLYWCRVFEIPVAKTKKAIQALPLLFEDQLPQQEFKYQCRKLQDNSYMAFAYDNARVIEAIEKSGLALSQINNIYLAQGQMIKYKNFQIDGEYYQYCNNILVHLPYKIEDSYEKIKIAIENDLKIDKVNIQLYANLIKRKYLETLFILLFMTSLLGIFKIIQYDQELSKNSNYLAATKANYDLPQSTIILRSILNEMEQTSRYKKEFKKSFFHLLSFIDVDKDVVLNTIEYKNNKLQFGYSNTDEKTLQNYLQDKIKEFKLVIQKDQVLVEVTL